MSIWKIAEYAVGVLPLGVFWAGERGGMMGVGMEKGTPDSARGGSPESEAGGALPPLRSPFSNLGHHASYRNERKSSVRAVRKAVRSRNP